MPTMLGGLSCESLLYCKWPADTISSKYDDKLLQKFCIKTCWNPKSFLQRLIKGPVICFMQEYQTRLYTYMHLYICMYVCLYIILILDRKVESSLSRFMSLC